MESNLDWQPNGHPTKATLMAALDRELPAQQGALVEHHVTVCPVCAAHWQRLEQVSERLVAFHREEKLLSPVPEFQLHLPAEKSPVSAFGAFLQWVRRPQFLMPAVAVVVILIGLALWTGSRTPVATTRGSVSPATGGAPVLPPSAGLPALTASTSGVKTPLTPNSNARAHQPSPTPDAVAPALRSSHHGRPPVQANSTRPAPDTSANSSTPPIPEVFWALPYSDPALGGEGAEMVRADLPREAFLVAGVPLANIPAAGPRDRIAADILIGVDGLPRAIRPARRQVLTTVIPTQL